MRVTLCFMFHCTIASCNKDSAAQTGKQQSFHLCLYWFCTFTVFVFVFLFFILHTNTMYSIGAGCNKDSATETGGQQCFQAFSMHAKKYIFAFFSKFLPFLQHYYQQRDNQMYQNTQKRGGFIFRGSTNIECCACCASWNLEIYSVLHKATIQKWRCVCVTCSGLYDVGGQASQSPPAESIVQQQNN